MVIQELTWRTAAIETAICNAKCRSSVVSSAKGGGIIQAEKERTGHAVEMTALVIETGHHK